MYQVGGRPENLIDFIWHETNHKQLQKNNYIKIDSYKIGIVIIRKKIKKGDLNLKNTN